METIRFKRIVIVAIILGFASYAGWKYYQVSTAFSVWKGGNYRMIPPNR